MQHIEQLIILNSKMSENNHDSDEYPDFFKHLLMYFHKKWVSSGT